MIDLPQTMSKLLKEEKQIVQWKLNHKITIKVPIHQPLCLRLINPTLTMVNRKARKAKSSEATFLRHLNSFLLHPQLSKHGTN